MKKSFYIYFILAIITGLFIAWNDNRPNWDDSGISFFLILISALLFGFLAGKKPWLIALAVGIWLPILSFVSTTDFKIFLLLIPAFIGTYFSFFSKKLSLTNYI